MFWNWLRPRPSSTRRRSFRPCVEPLEEILTPATFNVNTLGDVTNPGDGLLSLREAITAANADTDPDPDTIEFAPSLNGGTITLTQGELAITKGVSITGAGADRLTVSGNSASRVFNVSGGTSEAPVTISGLTITRGNAVSASLFWGGGVLNSGNLTLDSVAVTDSTAASGGGVTNNQGTLT